MYRQGDVLFVQVARMPRGARPVHHGILAEGEETGHTHEVDTSAAEVFVSPRGMYVRTFRPVAEVSHPEHGPIRLPGPGLYRVLRQKEYWPFGSVVVGD